MENGISSIILIIPFAAQPIAITKLISPLKCGTSLMIIPLNVQIYTIHVQVVTVINELVRGNEKSIKK